MSSEKIPNDDLHERVIRFHCLELPGQPMGMHMGTAYLIDDLDRRVRQLESENSELREMLERLVYEARMWAEAEGSLHDTDLGELVVEGDILLNRTGAKHG